MSTQNLLQNTRKPRIHIKYEVESEGAMVEKELPFVVGVIGDLKGNHSSKPFKKLAHRKFIQIDADNFNSVMETIGPGLNFHVKNTLNNTDTDIPLQLQFNSLADFEPDNIIQQVPSLRRLKLIRDKLRDLLSHADRFDELESLLSNTLKDPQKLQQLAEELGVSL